MHASSKVQGGLLAVEYMNHYGVEWGAVTTCQKVQVLGVGVQVGIRILTGAVGRIMIG
jgi:hypothetical protein